MGWWVGGWVGGWVDRLGPAHETLALIAYAQKSHFNTSGLDVFAWSDLSSVTILCVCEARKLW